MKFNFKRVLMEAAIGFGVIFWGGLSYSVFAVTPEFNLRNIDFKKIRVEENDADDDTQSFGEWLSATVIKNLGGRSIRDAVLGCFRKFSNVVDSCDFYIIPDVLPPDFAEADFYKFDVSSKLKNLNKIGLVFRKVWPDNDQYAVLVKELEKEEDGSFKFSLNKDEIEFGKTYLIEFFDDKGKKFGRYRLKLPNVQQASEYAVGKLRSFGFKEHAKG